jgi:hypothetical protein
MEGTSVTAVLIGQATWLSGWVSYEIAETVLRGNGLIGIYLNQMPAPRPQPWALGLSTFSVPAIAPRGTSPFMSHAARTDTTVFAYMAWSGSVNPSMIRSQSTAGLRTMAITGLGIGWMPPRTQ